MVGHPKDTEDFARMISELLQVSIPLRVAKAIPSDVAHGRVRVPLHLCPSLSAGDIVEIIPQDCAEGSKSTQGIVWRCRPEDDEMGVIRIDGIIRKNAGISLGDRVSLAKVEPRPCELLVISPCTDRSEKVTFKNDISEFVRRGLNKRPFVVGDRVFIPGVTLSSEALPFEVVDTLPEDKIVVVNPDTEIIVLDQDPHETSPPAREEDSEGELGGSIPEKSALEDGGESELIFGVAIPAGEDFSIEKDGLELSVMHDEDGMAYVSLERPKSNRGIRSDFTGISEYYNLRQTEE